MGGSGGSLGGPELPELLRDLRAPGEGRQGAARGASDVIVTSRPSWDPPPPREGGLGGGEMWGPGGNGGGRWGCRGNVVGMSWSRAGTTGDGGDPGSGRGRTPGIWDQKKGEFGSERRNSGPKKKGDLDQKWGIWDKEGGIWGKKGGIRVKGGRILDENGLIRAEKGGIWVKKKGECWKNSSPLPPRCRQVTMTSPR